MTPTECAAALSRHFGVPFGDHSFVVSRGARQVRVTVDTNSGMIHAIVVTAYGAQLPEVTLTRESSFDRLGKQLRVAREAHLGDERFDRRVYVDSTLTHDQLRWLFVSPTAREAILTLLSSCDAIELTHEGIITTTRNEGLFVDDPAKLFAHVECLCALYDALPVGAQALRVGQPSQGVSLVTVIIVSVMLFIGVAMATLIGYSAAELFAPYTLLGLGLASGLAVWMALVVFSAAVVSGRSRSFSKLVAFASASFFIVLPAGALVLLLLNTGLDASPTVLHRMPIRGAYMSSSSDEPQLYVEFVSPVDADETITLSFGGTAPPPQGNVVNVKVRSGGLGFPYRVETWYGP